MARSLFKNSVYPKILIKTLFDPQVKKPWRKISFLRSVLVDKSLLGEAIPIHTGVKFKIITPLPAAVGKRTLGEFAMTRAFYVAKKKRKKNKAKTKK